MLRTLKTQAREILNRYPRRVCRREFDRQRFTIFNERPVEYGFVFRAIAQLYPRDVLDVGTGLSALPHLLRTCGCLVTASDNIDDYWTGGMFNRHFHVIDDDITNTRIEDNFDMVTCVSVLEHIQKHDEAVRGMFSLLRPGGHLVMSFPYTEDKYIPNVYKVPGSTYGQKKSYVTQSYSREQIDKWLAGNSGTIIQQEYWQFWDGPCWTVGQQIIPPKQVGPEDLHQISCLLIRKAEQSQRAAL